MANNRIRYNWGVCTNRDADGNGTPCECCASKERQRVLASHEFVCRVCKEPLQKVQAPKSFAEKYKGLLVGLASIVVIGGVGAGIAFSGGSKENTQTVAKNSEKEKQASDSVNVADSFGKQTSANNSQEGTEPSTTVAKEEQRVEPTKVVVEKAQTKSSTQERSSSSSGSKNLGYAVYRGGLIGGKPDDINGRLTFTSSHVIDSRDPKGRIAAPGDYVIGEFSEGHLVQGIWYGSDNVVKGSIIIGK